MTEDYVVIPATVLENEELDLEAIGLFAILQQCPRTIEGLLEEFFPDENPFDDSTLHLGAQLERLQKHGLIDESLQVIIPLPPAIPTVQPNSNGLFLLSESHFDKASPLFPLSAKIIQWFNHHKGGARTPQSWAQQKEEFKKIYLDPDVEKSIEPIEEAIDAAIGSSINGKRWMAITYLNWRQYQKERWLKSKGKPSGQFGQNNNQPSGPWLGRIEIPRHN
jgi:hypothetical protein